MAAPTEATIIAYPGADGAPTNNTDPACGAIDTGSPISDNSLNLIISFPEFSLVEETYFGGRYFKNTASGSLQNARVMNRNGVLVNPIAGQIQFTPSSAADAGKKIFVWGTVGDEISSEYVTLPETATTVSSTKTYDAGSVVFYEFVTASFVTAKPASSITVSQSGVVLGLMRGTSANRPGGKDLSVSQLNAFLFLALRSAKNSSLSFADRKTDTADAISAYAQALLYTGADNSLPVQGNVLSGGQYVAVAYKLVLPANFPSTAYGSIQMNANVIGNAVA